MYIFHLQHMAIQTRDLYLDFINSVVEKVDSPTQVAPNTYKFSDNWIKIQFLN